MKNIFLVLIISVYGLSSCKKLLQVNPPKSQIETEVVFNDDNAALSAIYGIYSRLSDGFNFASGSNVSVTALGGLSADELIDYTRQDPTGTMEFELNEIRSSNQAVKNLWGSMYQIIYQANDALDGIEKSTGMTAAAKTQLRGECLLMRALSYFYLTNLFGNAPIITTTDYAKNAVVSRSPSIDIYALIIQDLTESIELLSDNYSVLDDDFFTPSRARPNKSAAQSLLARVYLYQKDWSKAEQLSSDVIAKTNDYEILSNLPDVFLKNSREAVWQVYPSATIGTITQEAFYFLNYASFNALNKKLVLAFEPNDARKTEWVRESNPGDSVFYPFKYRQGDMSGGLLEYSTIIRLAELYLIRAEARANQDNLSGAIEDLDVLRNRAGLPLIADENPGISKADLLLAVEHERQVELFTEWGHRWLDLKRTKRAIDVLAPMKELWQNTDTLYPVPASEFIDNPSLGSQNAGY